MRRKAGTNLFAMIILMFSITMFIGSLFYLIYQNPLNLTTKPSTQTQTSSEEILNATSIIENKSLEEAISEFKHEGFTLVHISAPLYLVDPQYLSYKDFKLKAIETNVIIISPSDSGIILVVQMKDIQYIWIPNQG